MSFQALTGDVLSGHKMAVLKKPWASHRSVVCYQSAQIPDLEVWTSEGRIKTSSVDQIYRPKLCTNTTGTVPVTHLSRS